MNKRVMAAVAAIVAAVVAGVLVLQWVSGAEARAVGALEPVDVVVVTAPIPQGQVAVVGTNIAVTQLPAKAVPADAVADPADLDGFVAVTDLVVGEQVIKARFADPNDAGAGQVEVPPEFAQVTVPMESERALGTLLKAGDTVGLVVSYADPERTTTTTMHRLLVSKLQVTDGTAEGGIPGTYAVTFAALPKDLEKVIWGVEHATVWLTLETEDSDVSGTAPVVIGSINPAHAGAGAAATTTAATPAGPAGSVDGEG